MCYSGHIWNCGSPPTKYLFLRATLINGKSHRETTMCWVPTRTEAKGARELPFLSVTRATLAEQRAAGLSVGLKAKRSGEQRTEEAVLRTGETSCPRK